MSDTVDLDRLDEWLSSDDSPEDCMFLSDLDGFMHGIVCGPVMVSEEEWLPIALDSDPSDVLGVPTKNLPVGSLLSFSTKTSSLFQLTPKGGLVIM